MKNLLTLAAAVMLSTTVMADDYSLYYVGTTSTTNNKIETVTNIRKLTFEDGKMTVTRTDGTTSQLNIASMKRLFFSTDAVTAIEGVKEDATHMEKGEVYDLTGRKLSIDLTKQKLPKGIYIIDGQKVLVK